MFRESLLDMCIFSYYLNYYEKIENRYAWPVTEGPFHVILESKKMWL